MSFKSEDNCEFISEQNIEELQGCCCLKFKFNTSLLLTSDLIKHFYIHQNEWWLQSRLREREGNALPGFLLKTQKICFLGIEEMLQDALKAVASVLITSLCAAHWIHYGVFVVGLRAGHNRFLMVVVNLKTAKCTSYCLSKKCNTGNKIRCIVHFIIHSLPKQMLK